jgi:hypothetical protein
MRVLIHNVTVNILEAADAWCLNYEGRKTYPNTPQLTELVIEDRSPTTKPTAHWHILVCYHRGMYVSMYLGRV